MLHNFYIYKSQFHEWISKIRYTLKIRPLSTFHDRVYHFTDAPDGTTFNEGTVFLTVWIPGLNKPLYNKSLEYKCMDFMKNIPFGSLFCPFHIPSKFISKIDSRKKNRLPIKEFFNL